MIEHILFKFHFQSWLKFSIKMIGISIFSNPSTQDKSSHNGKVLFSNEQFKVVENYSYKEYPISTFQPNEDLIYLLEGKIFDQSVSNVFDTVISKYPDLQKLEEYIFQIDGEFYLYVLDLKNKAIIIYGDYLNRLPLFYGNKDNKWVISRDINQVQHYLQSPINKLNLAEFFVMDYNLEDRTLFEDVFTLQMENYLKVDLVKNQVEVLRKSFTNDFSKKDIQQITPTLINEMSTLFVEACSSRANGKSVLSMSGGMDSRSVAAGLDKAGKTFDGITFEDEEKRAANDVVIAKEIADALKVNWRKVNLSTDSFSQDAHDLTAYKLGLQSSRLYLSYQYCRKAGELLGSSVIFFTGDGGDKAFPDLTKGITFNDDQKLFDLIIMENYEFTIKEASSLVGVEESDLRNQIFNSIKNLPGSNSGLKYEQFILRGRMKRYVCEGEDRNRKFFWSTSPFFSKKFFSLMMKIDPSLKSDHDFYRNFISKINPAIAEIRNENLSKGKLTINKGFYNFVKRLVNKFLSRKLKESLKATFKSAKNPSHLAKLYQNEIQRYADGQHLIEMDNILPNLPKMSNGQLSLILSYVLVFDLLKHR